MSQNADISRRVEESEAIQAMFPECEVHDAAFADLIAGEDVALPIFVVVKSETTEDSIDCSLILPIGYPGSARCSITLKSQTVERQALLDFEKQLTTIAEERASESSEAVFDILSAVQDRLAEGFEKTSQKGDKPLKCAARHILVKTEDAVRSVKERLDRGDDFRSVAKEFSTCCSKRKGGSLGVFFAGEMASEFDEVCFSDETCHGEIIGPVQTKYGYHFIIVDALGPDVLLSASFQTADRGNLTCLQATETGLRLSLDVKPGQPCTEVLNGPELKSGAADAIRVAVAAAPREGEANVELCKFLAKAFGVPKGNVAVVSGSHSHQKGVQVTGAGLDPMVALESLLSH